MRTTLTLDDDLAMMLKREAESSRRPFRDVVNDAIRRGMVESVGSRPVIEVRPVIISVGAMSAAAGTLADATPFVMAL